jgi:hypothetical protein
MISNTKTRFFLTSLVAASSIFAMSSCEKSVEEVLPKQKSASEAVLDPQCRCVMYTNFTITGNLYQGGVIKINYENGSSAGDEIHLINRATGERFRLNDNVQQVGASRYEVYSLIPKYVPNGTYTLLVSDVSDPTRNNQGGTVVSFSNSNGNFAEPVLGLITFPLPGAVVMQKYQRSSGSVNITWRSALVSASQVRITVFSGISVYAQTFANGPTGYGNFPGALPLTDGVTSSFPNNGSVNLPMSLFPVDGEYKVVIEGINSTNHYGFTDTFSVESGGASDM